MVDTSHLRLSLVSRLRAPFPYDMDAWYIGLTDTHSYYILHMFLILVHNVSSLWFYNVQ